MKHNWEYKTLESICQMKSGSFISADELDESYEYPCFGGNGIRGYIQRYSNDGDFVIIGRVGALCGNVNHFRGKFYATEHAIVASAITKYISKWLYYVLLSMNLRKYAKGAAQPVISVGTLNKLTIPVPPIKIQEQIVSELDALNGTIAKCRELISTLDSLAQSLFYDTFGDPVTNPKGWEIKNLMDICDTISTGITYKPDNVSGNGTIVLRSSNIQNSTFVLDDIVRIDMPLKPTQFVKKNDILMCSRNGSARLVGKVALIPELNEKMSWGAFMTIIRSEFYHYLFQYFRLPAFRNQLTKTKTTTVNQITIGMLKNIQLPFPPVSLQESFACKIEAIEAEKKKVEATMAEVQTLLDSRMDYWFN